MRPQLLPRFGVPFDEFAQRTLTLLNYLVKITYRSHLHLTSAVAWLSDLCKPLGQSGLANTSIYDLKQQRRQAVWGYLEKLTDESQALAKRLAMIRVIIAA